ncbi:M50 family metallopeptidase [Patescibacteria group bacterium]|nr:M50 family metallopeptidase [Patescibacteria group bacterium]
MKRIPRWLIQFFIFTVLVGVVWFFMKRWELVLIALASLLLHESGHYLAFKYYKVPSTLGFLPLGAYIRPSAWHYLRTNLFQRSVVTLAGPLFTGILAILGILFAGVGLFPKYLLTIASFNAIVGTFNLLPIIPFDGGRIITFFLESLERKERTIWVKGTIAFIALIYSAGWLLFDKTSDLTVIFALFLPFAASGLRDRPSRKAMTKAEANIIHLVYLALFTLMLVIGMFTPSIQDLWLVD